MSVSSVTPAQFREAMARWPSGVAVVTSRLDDIVHGMTVSAFVSVSAEPPCILVCLHQGSRTADLVIRSRRFAVNLLAAGQQDLAQRFAGRRAPAEPVFHGVSWHSGSSGCPLLDGTLAHLECAVEHVYDVGTHRVVIGRVEATWIRDGLIPLLYWKRNFHALTTNDIVAGSG